MKKPDEIRFLKRLLTESGLPRELRMPAVEVARMCGLNDKRSAWILTKATDAGWYEYGSNLGYGWLTDRGKEEIAKLRQP